MDYGFRTRIILSHIIVTDLRVFWTTRILNARFPTGGLVWTINPEIHLGNGFPDLVLLRNNLGVNPVAPGRQTIYFEGKNTNSGDTFANILTQLIGYTTGFADHQFTYLIGAKGRSCGFWRYTKGRFLEVERMSSTGNGVVTFADISNVQEYDIVLQQASIADMLRYIFVNPPPF